MLDIIQIVLLIAVIVLLWSTKGSRTPRFTSFAAKNDIIIDSCALIDGRILDIAKTGFISDNLVIPSFIISELQLLADGTDSKKRERARFGLDVISALKELPASARISDIDFKDIKTNDDKLLRLAEKTGAKLCTTDYNLNKVAAIQGITVLNVNELSNAIRAVVLPGEKLEISVVQKGSGKDQGVGYLDDGSMVVIAGASGLVGQRVGVEITRMLQSDAGKMLFAKPLNQPRKRSNQNPKSQNRQNG